MGGYSLDIAVITSFVLVNKLAVRFGLWPYSLVAFPGTALHELAHFIVAALFFASPTFPDLVPKKEGKSWTLGSVNFVPSVINRIPISLAPLLLLPACYFFTVFEMHGTKGIEYLLDGWVAGNMITSCLPSKQDWNVAMPSIVVLGIAALALYVLTR